MKVKIEHVNMTVSNIDKSFDFYHQLFGFEKRWEGHAISEIGPVRACHIGNEDIYLSLFEAEQQGDAVSDYGVNGVNHIGFEIVDLGGYRQRLANLGMKIHIDEKYHPGQRIYFFDPDGIEIELIEY